MEEKILSGIKERVKNATSGPWKVYHDDFSVRIGTEYEHPQLKAPSLIVTETKHVSGQVGIYIKPTNATFIAHAREDVELLLQALEETQTALLQAETQIHMLRTFKFQAELIIPNFQFEHISSATVQYLLQEQFKKTNVEDVQL